jgi:UPF0755 protein
MKKLFLFLFLAPLLGILSSLLFSLYLLEYKKYLGPEVYFTITEGERFSQINARLKEENLIVSSRLFHMYAKHENILTKFKVGTFKLVPPFNMIELVNILTKGTPIGIRVTVPEGKNLYEIARIFHDAKIVNFNEFIKYCFDEKLMKELQVFPSPSFEGFLFPDTYIFSSPTSAVSIIKHMVNNFKTKTSKLNLPPSFTKLFSIITLASIVEKETGAGHERSLIAGVFTNRLEKRMPLQSDPTTIYGLFPNFNGNLKKKDLLQHTPYNTYKIIGLPLGPITSPGIEAIRATLNPAKHQYLFFVSRNDGTHIFSKTYNDHLNAVRNFQINRSNREGKSWRQLNEKK